MLLDIAKRRAVDKTLQELGPVPAEIERLIEHYVGSSSLSAAQADELLNTLHRPSRPPPEPEPLRPSQAAPDFAETETDGPPAQRIDARIARQSSQPSPRRNTPFPSGLVGADELPDFARRMPAPRVPAPIASVPSAPKPMAAEVPEQSTAMPKVPHEDSVDIEVEDIVELDADDMLIDDDPTP